MVFLLGKDTPFPNPALADPDGLLALGGSLSTQRLIRAYTSGIFPWYSSGEPILWWSPDPRFVLFPNKFKRSKSLQQRIRKKDYEVRYNTDFKSVITACSFIERPDQDGTWITAEMIRAYTRFHKAGYAHSIEVWMNGKLAGGLYGVGIGRAFFGESMFHSERDASKIATWFLVEKCLELGIHFIDSQVHTEHLERLGAEEIPRIEYLLLLKKALEEHQSSYKLG